MERIRESDVKWSETVDFWVEPFFPQDKEYLALLLCKRDHSLGEDFFIMEIHGKNGEIFTASASPDCVRLNTQCQNVFLFDGIKAWSLIGYQIFA